MSDSNKVMRYLLKSNKPLSSVSYKTVCDEVLQGNETNFWNVLAYLKEEGFIKVREVDQMTMAACYMRLTDKGTASKQLEKERKAAARKNLIINFLVALVTAAATHFLTRFLN